MTHDSAERISREAAMWVAQADGGHWTERHEQDLEAWLARDPAHAGAFLQAQAIWVALDDPRGEDRALDESARETGSGPWFTRRRMLAGGGALAAAFAGGILMLRNGTSYTTQVGEVRQVPLSDGSTAAINTASTIDVLLDKSARRVRLEQGEAWFQVAKDAARPFIVEAGQIRVRAIGTAFSVRRRDAGADILVTEGIVEAWADGAQGNRVRLGAGARAYVADDAAVRTAPDASSAIDRTLAWRSGKIDLAGERLADAVAEFNRYNTRQLVIADPMLADELLDGVFRARDPDGFADTIKVTLNVRIDRSNPDQIRIGSPIE